MIDRLKNKANFKFKTRCAAAGMAIIMAVCTLSGCRLPFLEQIARSSGKTEGEIKYPEMITIDVYDAFANYRGLQRGWFARKVKEKFNMQLNIIAPNQEDNGFATYETMRASGKLGDLIIINADDGVLADIVKEGLVLDLSPYLDSHENLKKYQSQIEATSAFAGQEGAWAVPSEISTRPLSEPAEYKEPTNAPTLRWDLYKEIGYPEITTLEDLLPVLQRMQNNAGLSDSGGNIYALSLFKDWDAGAMQNASALAALYGYDTQGFMLVNAQTGDIQDLAAEDSPYMRALEFLFRANQMGLVDPESRYQNYNDIAGKISDGAVLYSFWPWMGESLYNSEEHLNNGKGFASTIIDDASYLCWGNTPGGDQNSSIMVGANARDKERLVDFVDWLYSPEGVECLGSPTGDYRGPEGLTWIRTEDGPKLTDFGVQAFVDMNMDVGVPEELGGGTWKMGTSALNFKPIGRQEVDEEGVPYQYGLWDDYRTRTKTCVSEDWANHYHTLKSPIEYLKSQDKITVMPGVNWAADQTPDVLRTVEEQCRQTLVDYSWRIIFAADHREYESLVKEMTGTLNRLGYGDVVEWQRQQQEERIKVIKAALEVTP